jgi:hypothetical protein
VGRDGERVAFSSPFSHTMVPGAENKEALAPVAAGLPPLPFEEALQPLLDEIETVRQAVVAAGCKPGSPELETYERLVFDLVSNHRFVKARVQSLYDAPEPESGGADPVPKRPKASGELEVVQTDCRLDIYNFSKWLKQPDASTYKQAAKGVSDDGLYTVSALLRAFAPRGYSFFDFTEPGSGRRQAVVIRGFRKFTGMTAEDEDEESGATDNSESFMYGGHTMAEAAGFTVTTKSNGENGKWSFREVLGALHAFAGSKNSTRCWLLGTDPRPMYPVKPAVPATRIIHFLHARYLEMSEADRAAFAGTVRALFGRFSALSLSHSKLTMYGASVWTRGALNGPKRWFPAPAGCRERLDADAGVQLVRLRARLPDPGGLRGFRRDPGPARYPYPAA